MGSEFEALKESLMLEAKFDDEDLEYEFQTVRKNALANPNAYGGKYAQKNINDARKEFLADRKKSEDDEASDVVELNDVELQEEPEAPEEGDDEDKPDMEKFSAMLRQSVAEEHEAAANYTKRAAKCEKHGMEDAAKLFRNIAQEEVVHVGEFQALMEKYGLLDSDAIAQGEQEAQEILSGEKVEPEIDADTVPADDVENESINEEAFDGLKEHFMEYLSDIDKTKAPGYYKKQFKVDKEHQDYVDVLVVEIAKSYLKDMDLQDPLQAQFEVEHEIRANFEKWLKEFQSGSISEAANYVVHCISNSGNSNITAKTIKEALVFLKGKNLDLSKDYFDIHGGDNTSELKGLVAWGGTGGYWARALNNPQRKDKEAIAAKEVKSLSDVHESVNANEAEYIKDSIQRSFNEQEIFVIKEALRLAMSAASGRTPEGIKLSAKYYPTAEELYTRALDYTEDEAMEVLDISGQDLVLLREVLRLAMNWCHGRGLDSSRLSSKDYSQLSDLYQLIFKNADESVNEAEPSKFKNLNSGDTIKTTDGREAVIESLVFDSDNNHIGYEVTYLDSENSEYEYNDIKFDDIAEVLGKSKSEAESRNIPDDFNTVYMIKSLLDGEKDIPAKRYTEMQVRNIYNSYLHPSKDDAEGMDPEQLRELYYNARMKALDTPIEEVVEFLNNTGDMTVTMPKAEKPAEEPIEEDAGASGTVASLGATPTVVIATGNNGVATAEPTKICEELEALQKALKG